MATKRELTAAEDRAWVEYLGVVESLTDQELLMPGYYPNGWSGKDLIAHVASWQAEAGLMLERMSVGTFTDEAVDVDALNERFYEDNKDLPLSVVRAESASSRTRLLQAWSILAEVTPKAEEWFVESGAEHYGEHLPRLRAWAEEVKIRR